MTLRRILLGTTAAVGIFVGLWAALWPATFYSAFPGLGRVWIAVDGPYNEHLIRDVGALYLALAAASIAAAFARRPEPGRVVGVAWTVFGLPHLIYHAMQFGGMPLIDVIGNIIGLGGSLLLGIVLMLPGPAGARSRAERIENMKEDAR
ncbi:hypothetical protein ACNPNP_12470 [Microbacterium sp. AGC85]